MTAEDMTTGESEVKEIENDYCVVTDGTCHVSNATLHGNGTVVLTIKGRKSGRRGDSGVAP